MPPRRRKRWHPVLPKDFLCCLSLQAGVVGCSVVGLTLMFITTLVNIYDRNNETAGIQATQYCLLFLYLIIMYAGFTMSFLAAFWEISKLLRLAGYFIFFGLALYIIYVIISIIPSYRTMINVCPGMRCPDHHWLNVDHWRRYILADELEERWNPTTTKAPTRYAQLKYPKIIYPEGEPNAPINLSSENSSDVLSLSFPRRAKKDETPTTQKEDEKPTTQKEDETPTTQKQDETPTTQKEDEKPTTQKEDEKPTTQKEVETPFTEGSTSTLEWNSTTNETTVTDSGDDNTTSHKGSVPTPTHYHPHGPGPVKTPSPHDDHTDDLPDTKKKKKKKKEGNVVFMILSVIFALFFVGFLGYSIITFVALANLYDSRYD